MTSCPSKSVAVLKSTAGLVHGFGCCSYLWTGHCNVDSALYCGQCIVLWTVHCAVDSALYCGQCTVLWTVHGAVDSAVYCGQCTVLWTVQCTVDRELRCRQCTVLWTVHCAVDSLLNLSGSVSSFVKLATNCLTLWLGRRGAVLLLHPYTFMVCTETALTRFNLTLLRLMGIVND